MKILLWILGGILALDAVMIAVFAVCAVFARHRGTRETGEHQALWQLEPPDRVGVAEGNRFARSGGEARRLPAAQDGSRASIHLVRPSDAPTPRVRHRPPSRRRLVALALVAAVLCAGTALASPRVRQVVATAFEAVTGGFRSTPSAQDGQAAAEPDGDGSSQPGPGQSASPNPDATPTPGTGPTDSSDVSGPATHPSPPVAAPGIVTGPAGPTIVTAVPGSSTRIDLAWIDVPDETGYRVERSAGGTAGWITIADTGQDVTTYSDAGLSPGTTYFYRIFATNGGGDSPSSDVASATTTIDPASPTTVVAVPGSSTEILLTWTDVAGETGYRVERSADGANGWVTIATSGQDVTSYSDAGLSPGTTYFYRIFATNGGGDSPSSDVASATTTISVGSDPAERESAP